MEPKLSKKEQKRLDKKQAKPANEPVKELNKEQSAPVGDETRLQFGVYPRVQSQRQTNRVFTELSELNSSLAGKEVWIRARVYNTRGKGNSCFVVLRRTIFTVQATIFKSDSIPKEMVKFVDSVSKESVVDILGVVTKAPEPITAATQQDVEIAITKFFLVAQSQPCPIQVEDCLRPEPTQVSEDQVDAAGRPLVTLKTRLDHRYLDMRAPVNVCIFRIQSAVSCLFREYLVQKNFIEIHSPKIIGTASEGGAQVFKLGYFGGEAYLAQSPQLYKQMAAIGELERVFEIAPMFRAENCDTSRHLTEFVGLDMEMIFQDHYYEVLALINEMFKYIFHGLEMRHKLELDTIREVYPSEPIKFEEKFLVIHFPEGVRMLKEAGEEIDEFADLSTPLEKRLGQLVKEKYGTDFYALDLYPRGARPFYTMPAPDDERYTNSYDLFIRGQEIASGSQRIHDPELLVENAARMGVDLKPIQAYADSFKYGSYPHAGCGIGLERVVMLYLGLHNIRKASLFPRDPFRTTP